jgi:hypothetical protein
MIMHASLTSPFNVQRDERNRRALHLFCLAAVAALMLVQVPCAHAQRASPSQGPSEKEKAKIQEKRAFEKDTDEAYQTTIGRMPEVKQQKVDPWGSIRTPPPQK